MKPHIKNLKCFPEVAAVIGESRAQLELWKVINCKACWRRDEYLINSFGWKASPQGFDFWDRIHNGANPYQYTSDHLTK